MDINELPLTVALAPIFIVIGSIYLLGPMLPLQRPWARYAVFGSVWLIVLHYLWWRLFDTVMPAAEMSVQFAWICFCFFVEFLSLADALILYIAFLRTTDRRQEADRHEARLRAMPPQTLPSVDILICTYNESFEVIEKTIVGALSMDYPNVAVWVLDDGRRPWLRDFCQEKGAGYITRADNKHAKAGNINHALTRTSAEYFAVFDADFVPQRNFLLRTMGFFEDPKVGIVQVPHAFYNNDPMQVNLSLRKTMPDDQRFFFEAIMPSRDGWDAAFCCGSNAVTRRAAIRQAGDALPGGSITEDMLLTLVMLRHGFITRYLCERLAFGLAPESMNAFFVQRQRWARGAIQMLFLAEGPLGPKLPFIHRLLFLPTHWLTQSMQALMTVIAPLVFLWTGVPPLVNVTVAAGFYYLIPMVLAVFGGTMVFGQKQYFPLAAQVLGLFQSLKILPTALSTLVKPHGHIFKVTPKGADAAGGGYQAAIFWPAFSLLMLTFLGLLINTSPDWRIVTQPALIPLVAFWCAINIVQLFLVCMVCFEAPVRRAEERFAIEEPAWLQDERGARMLARTFDVSLSGAGVRLVADPSEPLRTQDTVRLYLKDVGHIRGRLARVRGDELGIVFDLPGSIERDLLIRKLFTSGLDTTAVTTSVGKATFGMLKRIWSVNNAAQPAPPPAPVTVPVKEARLPALAFVLQPAANAANLSELASARRMEVA